MFLGACLILAGLYGSVWGIFQIKDNFKFDWKDFAIGCVIVLVSLALIVGGGIKAFSNSGSSSKCLRCGKGGNYSNGWCYSCYQDAKDAVKDSYNKYK